MEVPLSLAAELLLDRKAWEEFCAHFPSEVVALDRISAPPYAKDGYFHDGDLPDSQPQRQEIVESVFLLGNALVGEAKRRLISGEFTATGVVLGYDYRVPIDAELWNRLWPEFVRDNAMGTMEGFAQVLVRPNTSPRAQAARLSADCTDWMRKRCAEGESRRKILEKEAYDRFGPALKTRMFSAVYKAVHQRSRGRPRPKQ